jgi:hypothetical protein
MMGSDATSLFLMFASFAITFFVARLIGKRLKARRDAKQAAQAEQHLAQQSRQVRRAQARKKRS